LRPLERFLFVQWDQFATATTLVAVVFSILGHWSTYPMQEEVAFSGLVERLRLSLEVAVVMTIVIGADGFSGFSIVGFAFDYLFHIIIVGC